MATKTYKRDEYDNFNDPLNDAFNQYNPNDVSGGLDQTRYAWNQDNGTNGMDPNKKALADAFLGRTSRRLDRDQIAKLLAMENIKDYSSLDPNSLKDMQSARLGPSDFNNLKIDPSTRQAQLSALGQMGDIADHRGLDDQARSAMFESQRDSAANEQAQRGALMNDLQARGMGGSGAAISGLLANEQGGANRDATAAHYAAANAQGRALAALGTYGEMAAGLHHQDYNEAAQRAGANDTFALDNANFQQQANTFNAQQTNNRYNAQLQRLAGLSNARNQLAGGDAQDKANKAGTGAAIGTGIGAIGNIWGPAVGAGTMAAGSAIGGYVGGKYG